MTILKKGVIGINLLEKEIERKKEELLVAESIFNNVVKDEDVSEIIYRIIKIEEDLDYLIKKRDKNV